MMFKIRNQTIKAHSFHIIKSSAGLQDMDPAIWSRMSEELLEHILTFLPLKNLLNFRSTCKHFKSLIVSPSFASKHSSSSSCSSFSSFLLLSHAQCYRYFPIYDSILGTWRNLTISSLLLPYAASSALLSTSNGLSCFSLPNSSSFLICNLLAMSSRVVQFPTYPFQFELLTLVSTPAGYKIFMPSTGSSLNTTFVYDSKFQSWQQFDTLEPILSDNYHQQGAFYKGCLYFTTPEPFSIACFDLENGKWERSNTALPGQLTFIRLISNSEGKLYMIGGIGRNGISRSMKLWELVQGRSWEEVESLPEMMCRKLVSVSYHNYEHVYCFWHQGNICVCCYNWPEILYYKVSGRSWHWLPKCPSLPEKWSCGFRWFSFAPQLCASP